MKAVVITGSPHAHGTTDLLAERFSDGMKAAGYDVFRFDSAFRTVGPCHACNACDPSGECVQKDDMELLRPHLFEADVIAFVTPLYFMGMSAQIKNVIDRFYAIGTKLTGDKKTALICAAASTPVSVMQGMVAQYKSIISYLGWKSKGTVLVPDCATRGMIEASDYPEEAYRLGLSMGGKKRSYLLQGDPGLSPG
jgi:multimeric flavodoxin WrbA